MKEKSKTKNIFIIIIYVLMIIVFIAMFIWFLLGISKKKSCDINSAEYFTYGDFRYSLIEINEDGNVKKYADISSTFSLFKKEIMVIPEYIDGYPICIHLRWGALSKNENIKKIYILCKTFNHDNTSSLVFKRNYDYKIIFISIDNLWKFSNGKNYMVHNYSQRGFYSTNVNYYYNYENSPNGGYYWTDIYEDGERITYIPQEPIREGYIFDGWYKEPECVNKWNFDIDKVKDKEGVYVENALYAKWIEL